MNRRAFLSALGGSLLVAPLAAEAQQVLGETASDKHGPLLLLVFLFAFVVMFLLCAGLLMLVFRRVGPVNSSSPETGPRMRLPEEEPRDAGGGDPRRGGEH